MNGEHRELVDNRQMLKLKYLFDNRNLAEMVLKNWDHDRSKLNMLDYFRISANAVYPFMLDGAVYFLRFSPAEERSFEAIQAELDFIHYLRKEGYPAADTMLSRKGKELEDVNTPWGDFFAVVFNRVPGKSLDKIDLTDAIISGYGQALGKLHTLSGRYTPSQNIRMSWREQLEWTDNVLSAFPDEKEARAEVYLLRSFLTRLPATADTYGLAHYDFETDNIFYDETDGSYHIIDFDDCMYHWYVLDIEQALDSLIDEIPPDRQVEARELFLQGYRSVMPIEESMLSMMPVFRRYVNLCGYARILRSVEEKWENEPEWMIDLRDKLTAAMDKRRSGFGKPIPPGN